MSDDKLFEDSGSMDPTGIMSDESYIRGMSNDNPKRAPLMKKYGLKDDPSKPGVYGSSGKNFDRYKESR